MNKTELILAVQAALNGEWDQSHQIVQNHNDTTANWIHAVLHKIEGDAWNSRYWYARTAGKHYEDFSEATEELQVIMRSLG